MPNECRKGRARPIAFNCKLGAGHAGSCSPYTLPPQSTWFEYLDSLKEHAMPACTDPDPDHHVHDLYTVTLTLDGIEAIYPDEAACQADGLIERLQDAGAVLVSITDQHQTYSGYAN